MNHRKILGNLALITFMGVFSACQSHDDSVMINQDKNITIQQSCNSDAYYNSYIRFDDNGKSHIAIQSSQIIINTSIKIKDKRISFYFHSVKDLGRGGVEVDWKNISKSTEVLRLTALDGKQNAYKIKWYGLYDTKTKKYLTKSLFEIETPIFKACELNNNGEWQDILSLKLSYKMHMMKIS